MRLQMANWLTQADSENSKLGTCNHRHILLVSSLHACESNKDLTTSISAVLSLSLSYTPTSSRLRPFRAYPQPSSSTYSSKFLTGKVCMYVSFTWKPWRSNYPFISFILTFSSLLPLISWALKTYSPYTHSFIQFSRCTHTYTHLYVKPIKI